MENKRLRRQRGLRATITLRRTTSGEFIDKFYVYVRAIYGSAWSIDGTEDEFINYETEKLSALRAWRNLFQFFPPIKF